MSSAPASVAVIDEIRRQQKPATWSARPSQRGPALDFFFTDEERARCLPGAALLSGDALELASSLGLLYSLLAEAHLNQRQANWRELIEVARVPHFDGDLGRVERFQHEFVTDLLDANAGQSHGAVDSTRGTARLQALQDALERAQVPVSEYSLSMLRQMYLWEAWFEETQARSAALTERFSRLEAEVDLHPDLLDVLVQPFVGDLRRADEGDTETFARGRVFGDLIGFVEDSVGEWTFDNERIRFDDPEQQQHFEGLVREALQWQQRARESWSQMLLGFMDYGFMEYRQ